MKWLILLIPVSGLIGWCWMCWSAWRGGFPLFGPTHMNIPLPYDLWPENIRRHQLEQQQQGGGGSPAQPVVPTATPPPTANNAASLAVEQATYRQNLRRKNLSSTIYAGAGGWTPSGGTGTAPATPPK